VDSAFYSKALSMQLDSFDFMHRVCCHIALPAMRATNYRDIFYDQEAFMLTVASRNPSNLCSFLTTDIADYFCFITHL